MKTAETKPHGERSAKSEGNALDQLNALVFDTMRAKFPNTRPELLPRTKYRDRDANGLTQCVITWIKLHGQQAERINTTGRPIDGRRIVTACIRGRRRIDSIKRIPDNCTRGSVDISATINGQSVQIKVKWGRDVQSEAQKQYQRDIEASGGIYFIATSFEQFYQWYKRTFK